MPRSRSLVAALAASLFIPAAAFTQAKPKVAAATPEAAGEYLMIIGSCHDCHTAGWTDKKGKVAPDDQLTGNPVGYKGPWGIVYGKNLRSIAARQSEDHWVKVMTTQDDGEGNLPMPWHNMALMTEDDIRATYRYAKSLGNKVGDRIPRSAKPGVMPTGQFIDLLTQGTPAPADTAKKPAAPDATKKP